MTEPTTEDLVERLKSELAEMASCSATPMGLWDRFSNGVLLAAQRLSDLEGKLGEARKALTDLEHQARLNGTVRLKAPPSADADWNSALAAASEALKLTASGGGEDNSLSQGAVRSKGPTALDPERLSPDEIRDINAALGNCPPRRDTTKLPASELSIAELTMEQTRVEKLWDEMFEPDEDGEEFEGHSGSPGEWMQERMNEIATEQGRRAASGVAGISKAEGR